MHERMQEHFTFTHHLRVFKCVASIFSQGKFKAGAL